MKLICEVNESIEILKEKAEVLVEGVDPGPQYYIRGIFLQAQQKNRNGRVYPKELLQREVKRYTEQYILQGRAFGELGHPDGPAINLERVSHMIRELHEDGQNWIGKAKILDTPYGKIVKNFIDEGAKLGVSSRGMGSLRSIQGVEEVQDDYFLATAADIVADPSAPDAFVQGIMEGKEWIYSNGTWSEVRLAEAKKTLNKGGVNLEKKRIQVFEDFLNDL